MKNIYCTVNFPTPNIFPFYKSKQMTSILPTPSMVEVSHRHHRRSYHGGTSDQAEGWEGGSRSRRMEPGSRAYSTSAIHLTTSNTNARASHAARPKGFNSDDNLFEKLNESDSNNVGPQVPRPSSLENSIRRASTSSPQNLKDCPSYLLGWVESLSSEDMVPTKDIVSKESSLFHSSAAMLGAANISDSSRNGHAPYDTAEKRPPSRTQARPRSESPGSEMVTLEEFLEESNKLSPPTRRHSLNDELITLHQFLLEAETLHPSSLPSSPTLHHQGSSRAATPNTLTSLENCASKNPTYRPNRRATSLYIPRDAFRDNMLGDYFQKASDPPDIGNSLLQSGYRDTQNIPTSYVTPTVKLSADVTEERMTKPGQYVKPNHRPLDSSFNSTGSLRNTQLHQFASSSRQIADIQHQGTPCSRGNSMSRTFSVATADLLKANGPDASRMEKQELETPIGKDFGNHIIRSSTPMGFQASLRERPQSTRISNIPQSNDSRCRPLDARRLSLAIPKEERTVQSFSLSSSTQQPYPPGHSISRTKSRSLPRTGDVAYLTPDRSISSIPEVEVTQSVTTIVTSKHINTQYSHTTTGSEEPLNKGGTPKSTPASPDSNVDPQTVWYEYGCV